MADNEASHTALSVTCVAPVGALNVQGRDSEACAASPGLSKTPSWSRPTERIATTYSSFPVWLWYDEPPELESIPENAPREIWEVIRLARERLTLERAAAKHANANVIIDGRTLDVDEDAIEHEGQEQNSSLRTVSSISSETVPGDAVTQDARSSTTSATTTDSSPTDGLSSTRATSVSSGSRRPSERSASTSSKSRTTDGRQQQPALVMGPLGYTNFYGKDLKNKRGSKPPRTVALKKYFKERNQSSDCASCFETFEHRKLVHLTCQHRYCSECLVQLVLAAMKDENYFPPRCCLEEIPVHEIQSHLNSTQKRSFDLKAREYTVEVKDRWYCPNTSCSKWIDWHSCKMKDFLKRCPYCKICICQRCRGVEHEGVDECPQDFELQATLRESERNGWRRCYSCRTIVERVSGCRHMTCKCTAQFCYTCGARWRTCNCALNDNDEPRNGDIAARHERAEQEDAWIAEAVAAVERAHRREAERVEIEENRRRRDEETERRLREETRLERIRDRYFHLRAKLGEVHLVQREALQQRHQHEEHEAASKLDISREEFASHKRQLMTEADGYRRERQEDLALVQSEQLQKMETRHEEEEDDYFLGIRAHLRGKPNREARERAAVDKVRKVQEEERQELFATQEAELAALELESDISAKENMEQLATDEEEQIGSLERTIESAKQRHAAEFEILRKVSEFGWTILQEHEQQLVESGSEIATSDGQRPMSISATERVTRESDHDELDRAADPPSLVDRRHPLRRPPIPRVPGAYPEDGTAMARNEAHRTVPVLVE